MPTSFVVALILSQPLDTSKVETKTRRETLTRVVTEAHQLPSLGPDALSVSDQQDLEALKVRFAVLAMRFGLEGFSTDGGSTPGLVQAGPGPVRGFIAVDRARARATVTWTLTSNALTFSRQGPGCCPPCPCGPSGCAPCAVCVERGDCRSAMKGQQLIVAFTIEGRSLVREEARVQRVAWEEPTPLPTTPPRLVVNLLGDVGDPEPLLRAFRARQAAFNACAAKSVPEGAFEVEARLGPGGRFTDVKAAIAPEPGVTCVEQVLRGLVVRPAPSETTPVTIRFRLASP
jgi:hypothetical protein